MNNTQRNTQASNIEVIRHYDASGRPAVMTHEDSLAHLLEVSESMDIARAEWALRMWQGSENCDYYELPDGSYLVWEVVDTTAKTNTPVWIARCKSGHELYRPADRKYHACKRLCSRGELLCSDCATAEVTGYLPRVGLLARAAAAAIALIGGAR